MKAPSVPEPTSLGLDQLLPKSETGKYLLRLYVADVSPRFSRAIANLKAVCEEHLAGDYQLEIIDLYQQPGLASEEKIVASPTLIKKLPPPLRRLLGDLSDKNRLLIVLGVENEPQGE